MSFRTSYPRTIQEREPNVWRLVPRPRIAALRWGPILGLVSGFVASLDSPQAHEPHGISQPVSMQTQYQISLSDAPNNGRHGDDLKRPSVEKAGRSRLFPAILGAALAAVAAWFLISHRETSAAPAMGNDVPVSIPVSVQTVARQKLRLWNDFSGRLRAVNSADIRPEVSGRITEVCFQDGQTVKAGDILFVIDPRSYQATVDRDRANVASAQSKLELALFDQRRAQALFGSRAIAQSDLDKSNEQQRSAQAALDAARADLAQAEVDLDHAYVKASISGRVSRAELTMGNLVQGGSGASTPPPLLTSDRRAHV